MGRAPLGFPSSFAPRRYRRRTSRAGPGHRSTDLELRDHIKLILQSGSSLVACDRRRTVQRGSATGRAAGRLQAVAGYAERTNRGSPGGRDHTVDANSANVAKRSPGVSAGGPLLRRQCARPLRDSADRESTRRWRDAIPPSLSRSRRGKMPARVWSTSRANSRTAPRDCSAIKLPVMPERRLSSVRRGSGPSYSELLPGRPCS